MEIQLSSHLCFFMRNTLEVTAVAIICQTNVHIATAYLTDILRMENFSALHKNIERKGDPSACKTHPRAILLFWFWRSEIESINHDQDRFTQMGKQQVVRKCKNWRAQERFQEVHLFGLENRRLSKRWGSISLNNCLQEPLILHQNSEKQLKKNWTSPVLGYFFFFQCNKSC